MVSSSFISTGSVFMGFYRGLTVLTVLRGGFRRDWRFGRLKNRFLRGRFGYFYVGFAPFRSLNGEPTYFRFRPLPTHLPSR